MTWTGIATDLTLNDVIGPSPAGTAASQAAPRAGFVRPPADVYATEDMLPRRRPRYLRVAVYTLATFLVPTAVLWVIGTMSTRHADEANSEAPSAVEVKTPAHAKARTAHATPHAAEKKPSSLRSKTPAPAQKEREPNVRKAPMGAEPAPEVDDMSLEKFRQLSEKT